MMIHDNIEFHNVGALEPAVGLNGLCLARLPRALRWQLNQRARKTGAESIGCEMRFVTDAPEIRLSLSCTPPEFATTLPLRIFLGNFDLSPFQSPVLQPGQVNTVVLTPPAEMRATWAQGGLRPKGFAPNVWRVQCWRGSAMYCGMDCLGWPWRPPTAAEKPAKTYLAYGSSITHSHLDGYPLVAARRLGVQLLNLGLSGSCHAEQEMADYMANMNSWDFATLELGINMLGMPVETFRERVFYMVDTMTTRQPGKPIVLLTMFPFSRDLNLPVADPQNTATHFRDVVREAAAKWRDRKVFLIEGADILDDFTGLNWDLLHPSIYGHGLMGQNLAAKLAAILG
ncbi:MAG: SGNH/GDSL hydrolase family protein [Lentisphaeria bacterium]|nr:SGNH/GDSL hydrolase family protein [Lentisphaeria bacterium]